MSEHSARFAFPFILPGQAQKEVFHNEALAMVDGLLHPAVEGIAATPPAESDAGECWIVGDGASGDWAGREGCLALASGAGWRFLAPRIGTSVWDKAAAIDRRWTASGWSDGTIFAAGLVVAGERIVGPRLATIAEPTGGAVVDVEARSAVAAVIVALKSHGLID